MRDIEEQMYRYWLCKVPGFGDITLKRLINNFQTAKNVCMAGNKELSAFLKGSQLEAFTAFRKTSKPEKEFEDLIKTEINFVTIFDSGYPQRLRNIPDSPFALFFYGQLPDENQLSVAVIGARDCSQYGRFVAEGLGKELGERNIQVVSGMARGIDSISQEATLSVEGKTFAVLGCGVDICYPQNNYRLYESLKKYGGVISTYPPKTLPKPQNFPPRNRIVSGLSDIVVVVEARQKSGTLITVDMALEQGKEVYVVPGRITDRLSDGCNNLIKQGAGIIVSPKDFVDEITGTKIEYSQMELKFMSDEERKIYEVVEFSHCSIDEINEKLNNQYNTSYLSQILMKLCIEGYLVQVSSGHFSRKI